MENLEYEKSNLLLRLEMSQERADGLEKQLLDTQDVVRSSRKVKKGWKLWCFKTLK